MDKVEKFLVKQQKWMAWWFWKSSIIGRKFWKERYLNHKKELEGLKVTTKPSQ